MTPRVSWGFLLEEELGNGKKEGVEEFKGWDDNMRKGPRPEQNHDNKESISLKHHKVVVIFRREESP